MGHEFSGVVKELGEGVTDLEVGDHVVVEPYIIDDAVDVGPDSKTYHLSKNMNFIGLAAWRRALRSCERQAPLGPQDLQEHSP